MACCTNGFADRLITSCTNVVTRARRCTGSSFVYDPLTKGMGGLVRNRGTSAVLAKMPMVSITGYPSGGIVVSR